MFDAHVAFKARLSPRAVAVATPAGAVNFATLDADVNRFAAAFADLGLARREATISLHLETTYVRLLSLLAFARLGVATSPPQDPRADIRLVDNPEAPPGGPPRLLLAKDQLDAIFAADPRPVTPPGIDPDSTGRVMLSSGTTAAPRRVAYSWRRMDMVLRAMLTTYAAGPFGAWLPWTGVDSSMGLAVAIAGWATGGQVAAGLTVHDLPDWLEALPPALMALTPIQLRGVLDALPDGFQPRPHHRLILAGALLPPALAREARLRLTPDIHIIYGTTETSLIAHGHAAGLDQHPTVVGYVPPGTRVALLDDDGNPAPAGAVMVAGERVATGYQDDPDATAERFKDGWFDTGDLGRWVDDGLLVLEGRADERLNLGGHKFMPHRLEGPALDCPGVLDAACFAVPDAQGVDQAWLAVVAVPGFERDLLARHLAALPGLPPLRFAWTEEIPRNTMGKIERATLRDRLLKALKG